MSYRNTIVTLLAIAITPLALSAQPPRGDDDFAGGWGQGRMDRGGGQRLERLVEFLDLSDAQRLEIEEIMGEQRTARRATHETLRADGEALRALIESERPDPTLVGEQVIAMHVARKTMRQQGEADLDKIRSVLTPEQAERFDTLMEAREMGRDRDHRQRPGRRGPRGSGPGRADGYRPPTDG